MNFKITVFALVIIPNLLFGQFEVGILGAPSITHVRGLDNYKPYIGFVAGGYLKYDITKRFSVRTEISYETKSSHRSYAITFSNYYGNGNSNTIFENEKIEVDSYFKNSYINIPILFRMYFGEKIKFFLNTGPYIGILIKQYDVTYYDYKSPNLRNYWEGLESTERFNRVDFGLSAGLGIEIPLTSRLYLSFEFRNNVGLININKNYLLPQNKLYNYSGNFLIGFGCKF